MHGLAKDQLMIETKKMTSTINIIKLSTFQREPEFRTQRSVFTAKPNMGGGGGKADRSGTVYLLIYTY